MTWRGVLAGLLGLAALHALVSRAESADRAGQLLTRAGGIVRRLLDPAVPAIPDMRERSAPAAAVTPASSTGRDDGLVSTRPRPPVANV